MSNKVIVFSDSTIDLTPELYERYGIKTIPMHINLGGKTYEDGVNLTTTQLFDHYYETKELPKTAAINSEELIDAFKPYIDDGYEIVYVSLGSALSVSYRSSVLAAEELDGKLHTIDSCSLSTGAGLLTIEAAIRAQQGMPAAQIAEEVRALNQKNHASFVLDTLEFMKAGGRCSAVAAFGANLLGLKPCIGVDNSKNGAMGVTKKYRGKLTKVITEYIDDTLAAYDNIKTDRAFVTYSSDKDGIVDLAVEYVKSKGIFKEVFVTTASCTISSHCGPGTLGVLFMTE
ncbi:MAG: DegV family protein [Ruminococcus sp.]|nr:DegV family protein [Ruminococcus sp.]